MGLDVGGTKIAAGVASFPGGTVLARETIPTHAARGGRAVLEDLLRLARALGETQVTAIGLGICELVNPEGRIASANCIQWLQEPVHEQLSAIAPTVIEADVRAAAFAEALFGAGKTFGNFLYVTVGTGISCCLMLDGQPYLGARGATGTMASSALSVPCENCGNVNSRTLEEIASGPALVARFNAAGGHATSGQDVLVAAESANSSATEIIKSASHALGSQVGLLVNTLDPEAVIVGGGLGLSEGAYWDEFVGATRRHIWWEMQRDIPILRAATGKDAGWLGAAARAWKKFANPSRLANPR